MQLLFQAEANSRAVLSVLDGDYALSEGPLDDYASRLALGADEARPELDAIISTRSASWSLSRMNGVDRNLLRLALYEMLHVDEVEVPVTIDGESTWSRRRARSLPPASRSPSPSPMPPTPPRPLTTPRGRTRNAPRGRLRLPDLLADRRAP